MVAHDTTFLARFEAKHTPEPNSGCWLWTGADMPSGYGQIWFRGRRRNAHRASYEFFNGEVARGCEVHHVCNTRACVNPSHLVAVTHRINMRVSDALMGVNARKTHCKRGHAFDVTNTYVTPGGARNCRKCGAVRARAKKAARRHGYI